MGFTIQQKPRDEVYEAALNAARSSVFFPCYREEGEGGGGYLTPVSPPPSPYEVDFRKKGIQTWDAEITSDTNKEIDIWRSARGGVAHGLLEGILFFFHWGDSGSERLIWGGRRNTNARGE